MTIKTEKFKAFICIHGRSKDNKFSEFTELVEIQLQFKLFAKSLENTENVKWRIVVRTATRQRELICQIAQFPNKACV